MTLDFDFEQVKTVEFGVGRDEDAGQTFHLMPIDGDVQSALREMAQATWAAMQDESDSPQKYEASEKHASTEYVHLPLNDDLAERMRELHQANNMAFDGAALSEPAAVFCYFARMTDHKGRRLTALRRASQFEFAGNLQDAILQAAPKNIALIEKDLPFVDFATIGDYASKHPRAARYLASIRGQKETKSIDKAALRKLCKQTGVEVQTINGKITIADGHEMGFLEVLDRRRYELELVKGSPERFRASSRRKIDT